RPPTAGVELGVRFEQLGAARLAGVDAHGLGVGVLAGEGTLGAGLSEHGVLLIGELLAPLGIRLLEVVAHTISLRPTRLASWPRKRTSSPGRGGPGHHPDRPTDRRAGNYPARAA